MKTYILKNLDCANCALKMEKHLQSLPGVKMASVDFSTLTLAVDTEDMAAVKSAIHALEPDVEVAEKPQDIGSSLKNNNEINLTRDIFVIVVSAIFTVLGFYFHRAFHDTQLHYWEFVAIFIAYGLSGYKVLSSAFKTFFLGRMFDENVLMTIATLGAIALHDLPEAASVMVFFKIGDVVQRLALRRSRKSIASLIALRPEFATLMENNKLLRVGPETVRVGQTILVKPGEKIPLDGSVSCGSAFVDFSTLTGEHAPKSITVGDPVSAGAINLSGELCITVSAVFSQSSLAKIMELTQNAVHKKAKTEKFITSFARYYTPIVVGMALLVALLPPLLIPGALFTQWLHRALVLLVISCPCALVISIPLGYFGGIGAASKRGILIKGANVFDDLVSCKTVVFDKTGTLTKGTLSVTGVYPVHGFSESEIVTLAAQAQARSHHPVAKSIVAHYGQHQEPIIWEEFSEHAGLGITARKNGSRIIVGNDRLLHQEAIAHDRCEFDSTVVHVAVSSVYAGYITIGDQLKESSPEAIDRLRKLGISSIHLVTGDNINAARAVANVVGIENVHAELLPQDKLLVLESLIGSGNHQDTIAFVGDGINDAPVIARADIGIAMGDSGSDAAIETSDMVIMSGSPLKVAEAIMIARRTRSIVWQNIGIAFAVKGFFISLGILGIVTMWEAVFADMGVALWAIYNSTRAMKG